MAAPAQMQSGIRPVAGWIGIPTATTPASGFTLRGAKQVTAE